MIADDFKIDFKNKKISLNQRGNSKTYTVNELYSYLQDRMDEPQNMDYEIPIEAESKTKFFLINGWKIDAKARKRLKGGSLEVTDRPESQRFKVTVVKPKKPSGNNIVISSTPPTRD